MTIQNDKERLIEHINNNLENYTMVFDGKNRIDFVLHSKYVIGSVLKNVLSIYPISYIGFSMDKLEDEKIVTKIYCINSIEMDVYESMFDISDFAYFILKYGL